MPLTTYRKSEKEGKTRISHGNRFRIRGKRVTLGPLSWKATGCCTEPRFADSLLRMPGGGKHCLTAEVEGPDWARENREAWSGSSAALGCENEI